MGIGIACAVSDAIRMDYHLEAFIRWHAPHVQNITLNVNTKSSDNTLLVCKYLQKHNPNLHLLEETWTEPTDPSWLGPQKMKAFTALDTDVRILLDSDEFILQVDSLPTIIESLDRTKINPFEYIHFVRSWRTFGLAQPWPRQQWRIAFGIEHISTEPHGSNLLGIEGATESPIHLLHFGAVRRRELLKKKWALQTKRNTGADSLATDDWLTCAEGNIDKLLPISRHEIQDVPAFFKTPEFER